ncbi:ribosome-binding protein aMBF1 (putative translation factor) [Saccharopolyspora phatthalungensis]|uniref:Ribosome-binding protein aMBF1 (Putative translation factor) n=1 Tax=Saccharopolyspora phatthalungensis TaxID=664693 RepID=A0A840QJT1_9PSEU|nr:ribosome-binding protein aMBF1 (putative translation factor) [Saccharopolyspora phatthalungensis]
MGVPHRYPPNNRLAWERMQRGWSHDELASQLLQSMEREGMGLLP